MGFAVYAGIIKELSWYSYRIVVVAEDMPPPEKTQGEEEVVLLPVQAQSRALNQDELIKAHEAVYAHLGQNYDPEMAKLYLVIHGDNDVDPYPTVI